MKLSTAKSALLAYLDADYPAFLWGAPGIGKSDIVREVAKETGATLIDVRATLLDPVDLRGVPTVADGRTAWAPPAFLPTDNVPTILFLDELNAAPQAVQVACYQLVLDRRLGEYVLPDTVRIVAAGNRQSDRAGAQRMPSALANRFGHIDVDANANDWTAWANGAGISPIVVAFLNFREDYLHRLDDANTRVFPSPRSWSAVSRFVDLPDGLRFQVISGLVGDGVATEFEAFVRTYRNLPDLNGIIADPDNAPIPSEMSARHAVTMALSRKADRDTLAPIMRYADRLPAEFSVLLVTSALQRDKNIATAPGFSSWATRNADVLI